MWHFLHKALDSLPRKADDDCLKGALLASPTAKTRRRRGGTWASWIAKWQGKDPKLVDWGESNIEETLTFYRLPRPHHKHRKSTNRLKRLSEEIRCRTRVLRIFPNAESCPPWERGLPGRIEKGRQGCRHSGQVRGGINPGAGSVGSAQRDCLTHDNLFAQIGRHNRFLRADRARKLRLA